VKIYDLFPIGFLPELPILEIRLQELKGLVDCHLCIEALEDFGGRPKPSLYPAVMDAFPGPLEDGKLKFYTLRELQPPCRDRKSGREREADQRNQLLPWLQALRPDPQDIIVFTDLDEIPSASAVLEYRDRGLQGVWRFAQDTYYYDVNTLTDRGSHFASGARIGRYRDLLEVGSLYEFRMARRKTSEFVLQNGGWQFSYFGGTEAILRKTAALSPFLSEYRLFGEEALRQDIREGRDLHHRKCELPDRFEKLPVQDNLPKYFLDNQHRFRHMIAEEFRA
jgi:hypothetical protein